MSGLVGAYGSDDSADEEASADIQRKVQTQPEPAEKLWIECLDTNSGYSYFWNTLTNAVSWDTPPDLHALKPAEAVSPQKPPPPSLPPAMTARQPTCPPTEAPKTTTRPSHDKRPSSSSTSSSSSSRKDNVSRSHHHHHHSSSRHSSRNGSRSRSKSPAAEKPSSRQAKPATKISKAPAKEPVFYGPTLPEPRPEEIAKQKIRKFEAELTCGIVRDIEQESPLDWRDTMPRALHTKPFRWDTRAALLPNWKELVTEKAKAPSSMALIAGVYGDSDESEEEEEAEQRKEESPPKAGSKHKMQMQVRAQNSKIGKTALLKSVPSIFQDEEDEMVEKAEEKVEEDKKAVEKTAEDSKRKRKTSEPSKHKSKEKTDRRGRKIYDSSTGASYKKSIDDVAEVLCDKLEALNVAAIRISPLKLLAVQVETLFAAWQSSALSSSYLQKILSQLSQRMAQIESEDLIPPGWKATWDRYEPADRHFLFPPPLPNIFLMETLRNMSNNRLRRRCVA